jgi:hypothetical protein
MRKKNNTQCKKSSKPNQKPSRYHDFITKSQVSTPAKISSFQKSSYENRAIYLLRGQNPLSYYLYSIQVL